MSTKRPLTPEAREIAAKLKARIASIPGMTEERVGAELGVSQGQVSHWTNARLPVPARRAAKLASVLKFDDPSEISLDYREIVDGAPRNPAPESVSRSVRLDADIVHGVARAMQEVFDALHYQCSVTDTIAIFAELYDRVSASGIATADVVWLARRVEQGAGNEARSNLSNG